MQPAPAWIDAHTHVFVRGLKLAVDARYAPDYDASWQTLLALAEKNGADRAVILQPSFLGYDNSYLLSALKAEPGRFRGVPWISPSVETTADEWEEMARIGVRGLRFPIFGLPTPQWSAYRDMLAEAIKRDWPIHLYVESKRLPEMLPLLLDGGHKVVIPHFGMFDRKLGPLRDPGFELLLEKAGTGRVWVVLSGAYRVGLERARPAATPLLAAFGPDRLMWGSDWPHTDTDLDRVTTYPKTLQLLEELVPDRGDAAEDPGRHAGQALRLLERPALDAAALGAPAQHAARQVGDVGEARLLQDRRGMRRAAAGAAHRDDRLVLGQLPGAGGELAQRHQRGAADMAQGTAEFGGLAHVEHVHLARVLLQPVRLDFPDAAEGEAQWRPVRHRPAARRLRCRAGRNAGWPAPPRRSSWDAAGRGSSCSRHSRLRRPRRRGAD